MRPHHSTVPAADRYVLVNEGKPESMHQICIFRLTRVQIVEHSLFVSIIFDSFSFTPCRRPAEPTDFAARLTHNGASYKLPGMRITRINSDLTNYSFH
jgi:hypothetical protein